VFTHIDNFVGLSGEQQAKDAGKVSQEGKGIFCPRRRILFRFNA
jgi:hypothetical protein